NTASQIAASLNSIERCEITGNDANNNINASNFTGVAVLNGNGGNDSLVGGSGPNTLNGGAGNDLLVGAAASDLIVGGEGDDVIRPNGGPDIISGGDGEDRLEVTADANMTLTDTQISLSPGNVSAFADPFEVAILTGGSGANTLDATNFTGRVTLNGG